MTKFDNVLFRAFDKLVKYLNQIRGGCQMHASIYCSTHLHGIWSQTCGFHVTNTEISRFVSQATLPKSLNHEVISHHPASSYIFSHSGHPVLSSPVQTSSTRIVLPMVKATYSWHHSCKPLHSRLASHLSYDFSFDEATVVLLHIVADFAINSCGNGSWLTALGIQSFSLPPDLFHHSRSALPLATLLDLQE